jgi:hypothetical protein
MSDHAFDFLQSWVVENVKAMIYDISPMTALGKLRPEA